MLATILTLAVSLAPVTEEPFPGAKRVLILGDSITAAGMYTADLDSYFNTRYPNRDIEFINLGLPSETISGQSEPSHPWPRPNVHERLDRALTKLKPDVVIACYGMNDGIYHPFSDDRFTAFKDGVTKLLTRCRKDAIPVYLITPPPFDPEPMRAKLKPAGASDFGWMTPYDKYQEDVLAKYADWEKAEAPRIGAKVIDAQSLIEFHLKKQRTVAGNSEYRLADDGVHMNADGHWLIACAILDAVRAPMDADQGTIDATSLTGSSSERALKDIRREAGGVKFAWTVRLPTPSDPDCSDAVHKSLVSQLVFKSPAIKFKGLKDGRYLVYEGNRSVGSIEVEKGSATLDVAEFPELSINRRADELGELIRKRERILSPAWRDDVGHKRPDTAKGLPLEEAKKQAEPITAEIRRLRKPIKLDLSLRAN